ncbi:MAG TPA: PEGA domain-containing protein [Nitrospiraceae bacterium]|nr:PEGA domain-containing protein [Nitrospiraceae bacterium]
MKSIIAVLSLTVLGLLLPGCASVASWVSEGGLDQDMTFTSEPSGAQVYLLGATPLGSTPISKVKIARAKNTFVIVKLIGFEDQTVQITDKFNYWFWGNIICCGLLGSTTDGVDGATVKLDPTTYHFNLNPTKASLEERQHLAKTRWMRNLMLVGYPHIQQNLAQGGGEYLSSILNMLAVPEDNRDYAIGRLRQLSAESQTAPEFAEKVLREYAMLGPS